MRERVSSAPPALAVTGKGLSEGVTQSRRAGTSLAVAAASTDGGSNTDGRRSQRHKRQSLEKEAAPRDVSAGPYGRGLGREKRSVTATSARVSSSRSASSQHALHLLHPPRSVAVEVSLVQNLKKQITCLEAQLRVLKQQQDTMARAHRHPRGGYDGEPVRAAEALATARLTSVELPLPHTQRIHHADAAAASAYATEPDDDAVARMRGIPSVYQTERSTLLHNIESLTKDVEGLQKLVLHLGRERDVMAAEVVDFRAALREMKTENEAMAAECAATHRLLESEQALRRAAEQSTAAASTHRSSISIADAVSQRDYYRLQAERASEALALAKARIDTVEKALQREREAAKILETQLCSALDRMALMERREDDLAHYYRRLSGRFVTVSATLRHVLDVIPEDLLQQERASSPGRVPSGPSEAAEMTIGKLRDTLDAWHSEAKAKADAAEGQGATEVITCDALMAFDGVTAATTAEVSGADDVSPTKADEAAVTAPHPPLEPTPHSRLLPPPLPNPLEAEGSAKDQPTVAPQESAADSAALFITPTLTVAPQSSSWATEAPAAHPLPAAPTSIEGAGGAALPTNSGEKGVEGFAVNATWPEEVYGAGDATATQLPLPKAATVLTPRTGDAPALKPATVYHAADMHTAARPLVDEESFTEHAAFDPIQQGAKGQRAKVTEGSAAVHTAEANALGVSEAPSSSGNMPEVPPMTEAPPGTAGLPQTSTPLHTIPAVHLDSDSGPAAVLSSSPPQLQGEGALAPRLPPPLTFTATPASALLPAQTPELDAANQSGAAPPAENDESPTRDAQANKAAEAETTAEGEVVLAMEAVASTLPPLPPATTVAFQLPSPPAFAAPPPPPPTLVSVPLPPAMASTPSAPAQPSLEEQLAALNARIETQEAVLEEMVRKHRGL
ncbi:hypothetical protein LSCM1_03123 [Leishmania martiniquensis]|uniref:Uncharacterized protein n=1 Tax=Leishmania martiniquensis TaxID=1580590 RepID=A0A836HCR2_9TRYP|nr:hypothetical protein LSCM1_03123 [Leishmania martiniquensis]